MALAGIAAHPALRGAEGAFPLAKSPKAAARPLDASHLPADLPQLEVVYRPVDDLAPYQHNARTHPPEQLRVIQASMLEFGWTSPALIDEQGIIAGHGRIEAARGIWGQGLHIPRCPDGQVPTVALAGLSPAQRRAYILADNQIPQKAGWNLDLLALEIADLKGMGFDLATAGFDPADVQAIEERDPEEGDTVGKHPNAGDLLALVDITIDEPRTVERGAVYRLAGRHHLFCCSVTDEWAAWAPLLVEGALFVPYPGVFVAYGRKADLHPIVMVQPDPYIAGHILDRFAECYGEAALELVGGAAPAP